MISTIKRARIWRQVAAVAFAAMATLLLRPVCEAAEPLEVTRSGLSQVGTAHGHHYPAKSYSCCVSMSDASTILGAIAVPGLTELSPLPAALSAVAQHAAPESRRATLDPGPPPRGLSYHARSARLLL